MLDVLNKKLESGEGFSDAEILIIREIFKRGNAFTIRKAGKALPKIELGGKSKEPLNPITGYYYKDPTNHCLMEGMRDEGWRGQFAGATQWTRVGRVVKEDIDIPAYEYESLYHTDANPKIIKLYAYEQTRPI